MTVTPDMRELSRALGMSQRAFAGLLGIDYATFKRWAAGEGEAYRAVQILLVALNEGRLTRQWIEANFPRAGVDESHQ